MNEEEILLWIQSNFLYPHCLKANGLASLRNGIAIAELLSDILPDQYHPMLLPKIQISGMSLQKSLSNLKVSLSTIKAFVINNGISGINASHFSPENLYYRESDMAHFINDILVPLHSWTRQRKDGAQMMTYPSTVAAHMHANNISQLSEIANCSVLPEKPSQAPSKSLKQAILVGQEDDEQSQQEEAFPEARMRELEDWLRSKLKNDDLEEPDQIFGHLLNSIFSDGRSNDPIIKEAHLLQGSNSIYRKGLNYLLTSQPAERMLKDNCLTMLRNLQDEGVIKQSVYWRVLNDLYEFDQWKGRKIMRRSRQSSEERARKESQGKENIVINRQPSCRKTLPSCKQSKKSLVQCKSSLMFNYSAKHLKDAEEWISNHLGYEHSLSKSKASSTVFSNPLLNGSLIGSVVMRLKIGRPIIVKDPTSMKQVQTNWEQINKVCVLRGYQSLRKQSLMTDHNFHAYLGLAGDLKLEHEKRQPPAKKELLAKNCGACDHQLMRKVEISVDPLHQQKLQLKQWLQNEYSLMGISLQSLPAHKLTEICKELLSINILRETTAKIQQGNIEKILGQLRRLGLSTYYHVRREQVTDRLDDSVRWRILGDLKWILEGRVQYCRS